MNNDRRSRLADAIQKIEEAKTLIEVARDEEQDAHDNLPEGLQSGEKGEKMTSAIATMDDAISDIENLVEALNEASE